MVNGEMQRMPSQEVVEGLVVDLSEEGRYTTVFVQQENVKLRKVVFAKYDLPFGVAKRLLLGKKVEIPIKMGGLRDAWISDVTVVDEIKVKIHNEQY